MTLYRNFIAFFSSFFVNTPVSFYQGQSKEGVAPSLWTLTLSQVTTWIFARSLMTTAALGYAYGLSGVLAYAAYYLSFITGAHIIDSLRFKKGYGNIQSFMQATFGRLGEQLFNVVISLRLVSEVFANLLVIGVIFGAVGTTGNTLSIILVAVLTLVYSATGGLYAALKTDVLQALLTIGTIVCLLVAMLFHSEFAVEAIVNSSNEMNAGWILLLVAFLQVWSYPMHDPVMTDRGFLVDRETTKRSFYYAGIISILCIMAFGILGVFAGLEQQAGESVVSTLTRLFSQPVMILFNLALIISAISTLDSTYSSAAKLIAVDMKLVKPTVANGRWIMVIFLLAGLPFVFWGGNDLYDAVAVSGTASMFLTPVVLFSIWGSMQVKPWALIVSFTAAMAAGIIYLLEGSGAIQWVGPAFDVEHKYTKLLILCALVAIIGCASFLLARIRRD